MPPTAASLSLSVSLLLLALRAGASPTELKPVARPFIPSDLVGTWTRTLPFPGSERLCPKSIEHTSYTKTGSGYSVPHTSIKHDGVACGGEGAMRVVDMDVAVKDPDFKRTFDSDPTQQQFIKQAVDTVVAQSDSLAGFEKDGRSCGSAIGIFSDGAFLLIHEDDKDIPLVTNLANLPKGPRHMAYFAPPTAAGDFVGCLYVNEAPPTNDPPTPASNSSSPTTTSAATTTKPSDSASSSSPDPDDNDSACFPASARVELADGTVAPISSLTTASVVKTSRNTFSRVFAFTHADAGATSRFVAIATAADRVLRLSPGHYVYANGGLVAAAAVKPGDVLERGDGAPDVVVAVDVVVEKGLYNPQTLDGDIVVDGVRASTYTTAVQPAVAHAALAPLRTLFRVLGVAPLWLEEGASGLAALLPLGKADL